MSVLPDESINRILGWIEGGVRTKAERREQQKLHAALLNEYSVGAAKGFSWLRLWLLANAIGLDPARPEHLDVTRQLLRSLPGPRGPARPSRKSPGPKARPEDQRWGLTSDPRVGP